MVKKAERDAAVLHSILTKGKRSFFAGGKTDVINKSIVPLSCGFPYMDPWANPMLVKGVPSSTAQLLECARVQKPLFVTKNPEKPFVTRVGGNKSSALPNDVFDTIAEANETGGAIQRHRGTQALRFGLSASMDSRYVGSSLPAPPIRASALLKSTQHTTRIYTHGKSTEGVLPSIATGLNMSSFDTKENASEYSIDQGGDGDSVARGESQKEKLTSRNANKSQTLIPEADLLSSDDEF